MGFMTENRFGNMVRCFQICGGDKVGSIRKGCAKWFTDQHMFPEQNPTSIWSSGKPSAAALKILKTQSLSAGNLRLFHILKTGSMT